MIKLYPRHRKVLKFLAHRAKYSPGSRSPYEVIGQSTGVRTVVKVCRELDQLGLIKWGNDIRYYFPERKRLVRWGLSGFYITRKGLKHINE